MIVSIVNSLLRIFCTHDSVEVDDGGIRFRLEDGNSLAMCLRAQQKTFEFIDLSVSLQVQHILTFHNTYSHFTVTLISPLSTKNTFGTK